VSALVGRTRRCAFIMIAAQLLGYPHEAPQPVQQRLAPSEGPFQVRNFQDQGRPPFPPHSVHLSPDIPGHPLGNQHQPHPGVSPALGQQLPGFGGIVRRPPGNPGQGKGQQGAGIGDDEKSLVFNGVPPVASSQWSVKDFASDRGPDFDN
jgi:hypothetical protein